MRLTFGTSPQASPQPEPRVQSEYFRSLFIAHLRVATDIQICIPLPHVRRDVSLRSDLRSIEQSATVLSNILHHAYQLTWIEANLWKISTFSGLGTRAARVIHAISNY
jgi:hypothetical protein